jgi:predicted RNA binding protein YcfA (HicA-like mRNA interferase family)
LGERGTPRLTSDEVIRILRQNGFEQVGSSGSHQKWRHPGTGKQVIVAHHRGRILPLGTMRAIIDGSGIPSQEWFG